LASSGGDPSVQDREPGAELGELDPRAEGD
jgi:hypothetical protein